MTPPRFTLGEMFLGTAFIAVGCFLIAQASWWDRGLRIGDGGSYLIGWVVIGAGFFTPLHRKRMGFGVGFVVGFLSIAALYRDFGR